MAMEFNALLPVFDRPEFTQDYEGFFHLIKMDGAVEKSSIQYIIRDHNRELFIQLMRVCFKKDVNGMLGWTDAIATQTREGQKLFLKYALHMVRQSILKNYTQEMLTRVSQEEADFLKNFARFITNNNVMDFMQLFNDAHYHLERNAHAKLLFTQLCFQVMRFIHRA